MAKKMRSRKVNRSRRKSVKRSVKRSMKMRSRKVNKSKRRSRKRSMKRLGGAGVKTDPTREEELFSALRNLLNLVDCNKKEDIYNKIESISEEYEDVKSKFLKNKEYLLKKVKLEEDEKYHVDTYESDERKLLVGIIREHPVEPDDGDQFDYSEEIAWHMPGQNEPTEEHLNAYDESVSNLFTKLAQDKRWFSGWF